MDNSVVVRGAIEKLPRKTNCESVGVVRSGNINELIPCWTTVIFCTTRTTRIHATGLMSLTSKREMFFTQTIIEKWIIIH